MKYLINYMLIINVVSFFSYGIDKMKAKRNSSRIRESSLLFLGFLGGMVGSILGMIIFHHKTKKNRFWILNILFIIMWLYILYSFVRNGIIK